MCWFSYSLKSFWLIAFKRTEMFLSFKWIIEILIKKRFIFPWVIHGNFINIDSFIRKFSRISFNLMEGNQKEKLKHFKIISSKMEESSKSINYQRLQGIWFVTNCPFLFSLLIQIKKYRLFLLQWKW